MAETERRMKQTRQCFEDANNTWLPSPPAPLPTNLRSVPAGEGSFVIYRRRPTNRRSKKNDAPIASRITVAGSGTGVTLGM